VPKIGVELNAAARGFVALPEKNRSQQAARFGSRGEDFAVGRRLR
jgi:hypothetical protein